MRTLVVIFALLLAAPAAAKNELAVRLSGQVLVGDGAVSAAGASLVQAEVGYGRAIWGRGRHRLWLEGSWTIGEGRGQVAGALASTLLANHLTVGGRWTIEATSWLSPHLRLGGGLLLGTLDLQGAAGVSSTTAAGGAGYALAGASILLPQRWGGRPGARGFTLGVVVEGGGARSSPLSFRLAAPPAGDEPRLTVVGASLGSFVLQGGLVRAGVVARF